MNLDRDGDSQMASSPESSVMASDESNPGTRTPTNTVPTHVPQFDGSELSPPGSQTQGIAFDGPGKSHGPGGQMGSPLAAQTYLVQGEQQSAPGASWMNKRAEEEFQRAMEFVTDLDFSLEEFGDPFDDRDMEEGS
ncbi:uncharacterized protein BO97DRAFT_405434 [Aspergillus homomorphus CBS 101889]|uniref:Uncharacterized protein n=1 Tax=Aspergillus homomorphus (strain CBS 101889) TaxID=1450537 RepID=A0A395HY83_ASPHC|nr:hypothetical protein BO97DRAFT_405434 [Aspergillus homomorphus CBS 101889]RAL12486.1 hypothetical protein BO97DRAFT_405434 [Aspergillus homomorphus CBS 101889]